MKKLYLLLLPFFVAHSVNAQTAFCNGNGNVIIYSNYDGGVLNINVDQNIPNIKIGVVTYEPVTINVTGTYSANVTEVRYAGYVSTNNNHCSNSPSTTTINAGSATTSVNFVPAATYANANGYSMIICNYSCNNTTNQGGCNTPDQIVDYFMSNFGGTLYYHFTQYGCWSTTPYNVSAGGNCCIVPTTMGIVQDKNVAFTISPNPSAGKFLFELPYGTDGGQLELKNVLGQTMQNVEVAQGTTSMNIDLGNVAEGIYLLSYSSNGKSSQQKIVVQN